MLADKVGRPIQESLLALLIYDNTHGGVVAKMLSPEMFDGDYADIARKVGSYWASYNKAPGKQVDDLFADIFTERTGRDITYGDLFVHFLEMHQEGINVDFLLDTIHKFTRLQRCKRLLVDSAERVQNFGEDALEDVDRDLDSYRRLKLDATSPALTLFEYEKILAHLERRSVEFDTGIRVLDRAYIVPAREAMFLILGPPGAGKSWSLVQIGKRAMLRRKRVLYISLEMDAHEVGTRFYQSILGVTTRQSNSTITNLQFDDDGKFAGFDRAKVESRFSLMDDSAGTELAMHIRQMEGMFGYVRIHRYPGGTLTPAMIEALLDSHAAEGYIVDMVLLDYIGIMKVDPNNLRISLGHTGVALRGIAQSRGIAVVTAQQVGRGGVKEQKAGKEIDLEHIAEDWTLVQTADVAVTMSQTRAESELGLMRLFVGKGRTEAAKFTVVITQNYAQGQFALDSYRIPNGYAKALEEFLKESKRAKDEEPDDPD